MIRRAAAALIAVLALLCASAGSASASVPHIKHVFIIALENENAADTFGPGSPAPYLAQTLRSRGAFLPNYYAIGHLSLDNYIAMVSGQGPNGETQSDCQFYTNFLPGTPTTNGQYIGQGCVYPPGVKTIANQLEGSGNTWKGYMEDMGTACRHPAINAHDDTQTARVGDQYAARHNPFVYFHSITDFPTCGRNDVDYSRLAVDLRQASTTPNYAFITPNLCNDGHDSPCVDGRPGGLPTADQWLRSNVPTILNSSGFKDHGLLVITFDEANAGPGGGADASACCGEVSGPNTINPGGPTAGPGGGRVGAVLLSPCIKPKTMDSTPYNHYSLLRTIERNFGLPYLGFARQPNPGAIGSAALNDPGCHRRV
jgi:phosphatidylinositol-3-phosphatase